MSRHTISFPRRQAKHGFFIALVLLAWPILLCACAPFVLTADDRAAINTGNKGLVLLRIFCTVDDKPFEPCLYRRNNPLLSDRFFVGFALGSFDSFGEPGYVKIQALSDESFEQGWAFLLISPGIYYLYVRGPDSSESSHAGSTDYYSRRYKDAPRWRIDVPEGAKLIYAGTLTLAGKQNGTLIFGDKIIVPVENQQLPLSDDSKAADSLLAKHFPGKDVHNIMMRPWLPGDPFIFRSPLPIK